MKRAITICAVAALSAMGELHAQGPAWEWAASAGGPGVDQGVKVVADGSGGAYLFGTFRDSAAFGRKRIKSYGKTDIFLARYSVAGECLWVTPMGSAEDDAIGGITIDASGNVHVSGTFVGTVNFPREFPNISTTQQIHSEGGVDIFVATYLPDGTCETIFDRRGVGTDEPHGFAADAGGNTYLVGGFTDMISFLNDTVTSAGGKDIFLAKQSSEDIVWLRRAGGAGDEIGTAVGVDNAGRIYITASFSGTATFGDTTISTGSARGLALACYNSDGSVAWARAEDATTFIQPVRMAVDGDGNLYVTAAFNTSATIGTSHLTSEGEFDILLAAYDRNGAFRWAKQIGGDQIQIPTDITTDTHGDIYLTGISQNLDDGTLFVGKYGNDGTEPWLAHDTWQGRTGIGNVTGGGVGVDADGNVFVSGDFGGEAIFGTKHITSVGSTATSSTGSDAFIAKLNNTSGVPVANESVAMNLDIAPNPATGAATLRFELLERANVRVVVSDLAGRMVRRIEQGPLEAGGHAVAVNVSDLPQGYYLLQVHANGQVMSRGFTVVR
jgi:hypothetical protein